jgi:hypothetical protein
MTALVSAELFRLRTIRSPLAIAAGVLALVALLAIIPAFDAGGPDAMTGPDVIELLQIAGGVLAAIGIALLAAATAAARPPSATSPHLAADTR